MLQIFKSLKAQKGLIGCGYGIGWGTLCSLWGTHSLKSNIFNDSIFQGNVGTCTTRHCTHLDAAPRNVPCHTAGSINEFLAERKYSCGSSASIFARSQSLWIFFSPAQKSLERRHLGNLDNIQKSVTDKLNGIPAEAFQHCYEQWKQRIRRCVANQGNYIEGENLDLCKE